MLLTIVMSLFLVMFSAIVMSYIAMATPIGPWIAPTLVFLSMAFLRLIKQKSDLSERLVLCVATGSIGGIMATACGFALPTLYFLDDVLFTQWLNAPLFFISVLASLSFFAGWLGLWLANAFEESLIVQSALPFPVGNMIYKVIVSQTHLKKTYDMSIGFWSTICFCFMRSGIGTIGSLIPKVITLLPSMSLGIIQLPAISLSLMPMFWAIGFVTGMGIISSLAIGSIAKIVVIEPVRQLYFLHVEAPEFILAFCSGIVIAGALHSFLRIPDLFKFLYRSFNHFSKERSSFITISSRQLGELLSLCVLTSAFLYYFKFGFVSQAYLIFFAAVCAYQIAVIAGKIGLAQLGRFATFVMVPAIFLFKLNYVQTVFIATFVEICGGVMADILFGRKLAYLSHISKERIKKYQYFGLFISSLAVAVVFWILLTHLQLGGAELFAQRAQARALLIKAQHFNFYVLLVGLLFGSLIQLTPLSPMLFLGGILMPLNVTLGFVAGALLTLFVSNPEKKTSFWSGVFVGNSIWMIVWVFLRYILKK